MPAAAVIPAPLAYIKVVAVKKLVVEFWTSSWVGRPSRGASGRPGRLLPVELVVSSLNRVRSGAE